MSDATFSDPMLFLPHTLVQNMIHVGGGIPEGASGIFCKM